MNENEEAITFPIPITGKIILIIILILLVPMIIYSCAHKLIFPAIVTIVAFLALGLGSFYSKVIIVNKSKKEFKVITKFIKTISSKAYNIDDVDFIIKDVSEYGGGMTSGTSYTLYAKEQTGKEWRIINSICKADLQQLIDKIKPGSLTSG